MYYRSSSLDSAAIIAAIVLILALAGSLLTYFLFLNKKNSNRFTGFLGWLYDFLSFRKLMLESLLIVLYIFCAILFTVLGFISMFQSFMAGLCVILFGNVLVRILYEFAIIKIISCKNTSEINSKLDRILPPSAAPRPNPSAPKFVEPKIPARPSVNICPHCGKQIKPGASFCPYCGKSQR